MTNKKTNKNSLGLFGLVLFFLLYLQVDSYVYSPKEYQSCY